MINNYGKVSPSDRKAIENMRRRLPRLEHDETIRLIGIAQSGGDDAAKAKQRVIEGNIRLAMVEANRVYNSKTLRNVSLADLIQEGAIGLSLAIDRFEIERGLRFSSYAIWWIRQRLANCIYIGERTIRVSNDINEKVVRLKRLEADFTTKHGRKPTLEELAEAAELSIKKVKHVLEHTTPIGSLNVARRNCSGDDERSEILDVIPAGEHGDADLRDAIDRFLEVYPDGIQKTLFVRFYGLDRDEPESLKDLMQRLDINFRQTAVRERKRAEEAFRCFLESKPMPKFKPYIKRERESMSRSASLRGNKRRQAS